MKKRQALLLTCVVLCTSLIGCGGQSGQTVPESMITQEIIAQSTAALESPVQENANQGNAASSSENSIQKEADEEYVYDYQVSMDPIPKEIADLGGPCQGTIHAFPSKIRIGLTEKRMEEDPKLKAEIERRIPEIEQELFEKTGEKFCVDGVDATRSDGMDDIDEMDWNILCTEVDTGEQFWVFYTNLQYCTRHDDKPYIFGNKLRIGNYYAKKALEELKENYIEIISDIYDEGYYNISCTFDSDGQSENYIGIYIYQFTDEEISIKTEQKKIAKLWKCLQEYSNENKYFIKIVYFPQEYMTLVSQKITSIEEGDWGITGRESMKHLIENGEIKNAFIFDDIGNDKDLGEYVNQEVIWPYWIKKDWRR